MVQVSFAQTTPSDLIVPAQPTAPVQAKGEVLEDYAYQVRLSLPNDRWQFLDQKRVNKSHH